MAESFYQAGEQRAAKVNDLFAAVAPRYDLINDLQSFGLHRVWKRRLVRLAEPAPGQHTLDLCCGTGDVAFALAEKGCTVTGFDFSEPMLAVARRRAELRPEVTFVQGDALHLPFADNQFDTVTISYGLRNLADLDRGISEIRRVLKPGGRALALDFGKPDTRLWRGLYFRYLRWLVPLFGWLFCGNTATHAYILESLRHYPGQHGVDDRLRAAGFDPTRIVPLLGGAMSINIAHKPR